MHDHSRTKMLVGFCLLVLGGVLLGALPAAQANSITSIAYDGTGCPPGSAGVTVAEDGGQSATVIFASDLFKVSTGPGVPESDEVKDCHLTLTLETNESVGLRLDTRGFVSLPAGMTGEQHQNVPRAKQANQVTPFAGPMSRDYGVRSTATVLAQGT